MNVIRIFLITKLIISMSNIKINGLKSNIPIEGITLLIGLSNGTITWSILWRIGWKGDKKYVRITWMINKKIKIRANKSTINIIIGITLPLNHCSMVYHGTYSFYVIYLNSLDKVMDFHNFTLNPWPNYCCPHPYDGSAFLNGNLKIVAHSHREVIPRIMREFFSKVILKFS